MAEGILRQSYDSTGKKIYPLTVIDGIIRRVDVNVMEEGYRGANAIIDSMKGHNVDFEKGTLSELEVLERAWNEETHEYGDASIILSVSEGGLFVNKTSTFGGDIKAYSSIQGTYIEVGEYDNSFDFKRLGGFSINNNLTSSGKIELFDSTDLSNPFFVVNNGGLNWKSSGLNGKGLSVNGTSLTYDGAYVDIKKDVSVGNNLKVKKDSSIGGDLYVGGGITFNGTLYANKDASIRDELHVYDLSYGAILDVSEGGTQISTDTTITEDLTVNGAITATNGSSIGAHNLVTLNNELNLAGNLSADSLYFNYRSGNYIEQIYMCAGNGHNDPSPSAFLTKVVAKSLQIGGNDASYTDSSLLLWTYGEGGSPSIEFRRGVYNDGFTDWRIVSENNTLKIKYRQNSGDYSDSVYFDEGKLHFHTNGYISSNFSNNMYVSVDSSIPLVVEKNSVRRDASSPDTDLGTSSYPWRTGYFDSIYSDKVFSDSIKIQGTETHMATISARGWYKIGETDTSVNGPASNPNIFIVNRLVTEGYIISFVNDYLDGNGDWSDNDSSVHVQVTQISGNYGKHHCITKFATICNEYKTEYYMFYDLPFGYLRYTSIVYISCIGTASPIAPSYTGKGDSDMATGSVLYTDRGVGIRGDFYVNGNYNSSTNGRNYTKISEDTISAYSSSNAPSILYTGDSSVYIKNRLSALGDVYLKNKLIFGNNGSSENPSVSEIHVEETIGTNRELYIKTDKLCLSKGDFGKYNENPSLYDPIEQYIDGHLYVYGKAKTERGATIKYTNSTNDSTGMKNTQSSLIDASKDVILESSFESRRGIGEIIKRDSSVCITPDGITINGNTTINGCISTKLKLCDEEDASFNDVTPSNGNVFDLSHHKKGTLYLTRKTFPVGSIIVLVGRWETDIFHKEDGITVVTSEVSGNERSFTMNDLDECVICVKYNEDSWRYNTGQ